jgi:hypothetical protein
VAGSSHESIPGIVDTALFYSAEDPAKAREILQRHDVRFVIAYDADRTAQTAGQVLGRPAGEHAVCYVLDRAPAMSPGFLVLAAQNPAGKLFRVTDNR